MITAGIDAGTENLKVVILDERQNLSYSVTPLERKSVLSVAHSAFKETADKAGVSLNAIDCVVATGVGSDYVSFVQAKASEAACCARGAIYLIPSTGTVIDLGADKCLVVKTREGRLLNTVRNDRCASGSGRFLEIASKPLGTDPEGLGQLSLRSQKDVVINNNCAVFAESEIISLIHLKHQPEDIAKAIFRGLARRIYTLIIKADFQPELVMVGGVARNVGMVTALEELVGCPVLVPQEAMIVGALGAALIAARKQQSNRS